MLLKSPAIKSSSPVCMFKIFRRKKVVEGYDEIAMTCVMLNIIKTTSLRNNHIYISLVIRYVSADFMKAVKYLVLQAIKHGSLHFENLLAFLTSL